MKQTLGKQFVLIPIGVLIVSGALASRITLHTADLLTGAIMGIGIGLASLPFIAWGVKARSR